MRNLFLPFLFLLATVASAQQGPPTAQQVRQMINGAVTQLKIEPQAVASVADSVLINGSDSITVRIYRPKATGSCPIVYFIHGGAYIAGDLNSHDNVCRMITNRLQAIVVAVDYRRPPEYRFPVPVNDAWFGFQWVAAHAKDLGGNGQMLVMGDSAGGHLTALVCQRNAGEKKPAPVTAQVLVNPALDVRSGSPTDTTYGMFINWTLNPTDDRNSPGISPLLVKDLSKQPPAVIVVGAEDEIRDDGITYHQRLMQAGVASTLYKQPKMGHLGPLFCAAHPAAMPAIDFVVATLQGNYLKK